MGYGMYRHAASSNYSSECGPKDSDSVHLWCIHTNMSSKRSEESFRCSMLSEFGRHLPKPEHFGFRAYLSMYDIKCVSMKVRNTIDDPNVVCFLKKGILCKNNKLASYLNQHFYMNVNMAIVFVIFAGLEYNRRIVLTFYLIQERAKRHKQSLGFILNKTTWSTIGKGRD